MALLPSGTVSRSLAAAGLAIGPLSESEEPAAVAALARAFRDNPLNLAVIRSADPERRLRCNRHGMRLLLPSARAHGHLAVARRGGAVAGALVAAPPFAYPLPAPSPWQRLRCLAGQGPRVAARWGRVFRALDALHPRAPHWYLGTLGVDPPHQGRGIGRALLEAWVARVDADALPAYLETDRLENVAFYGRAGFALEGELRVLGTAIWRMRRPARPPFPPGAHAH